WMMARDPKTWSMAVMFGLGHGGVEAILLVGVNSLASLALLLFFPAVQNLFPAEINGLLAQQVVQLGGSPAWLPLLAAWERLWTLPVHVALSVVVLQVFLRSGTRWLWIAIVFHGMANLIVVGLPALLTLPGNQGALLSSALVLLVGLFAVWVIFRLRGPRENP
ncbi:MAG: YhfC family intramembrane metalloprotease, partial [Anaerolineaceae bacterium]|nr:YhfC family intramembrane metalloprotease [Anaerolineaceae bacterium]